MHLAQMLRRHALPPGSVLPKVQPDDVDPSELFATTWYMYSVLTGHEDNN